MIEGRGISRDLPPVGICEWCFRSTWDMGKPPLQEGEIPVHITCLMQMISINHKVIRGVPITGRTLAERRYLRLKRIWRRRLQEAEFVQPTMPVTRPATRYIGPGDRGVHREPG